MPNVSAINAHLQRTLEAKDLAEVDAVTAAQWLDRAGLLADSASRPGWPLRKLLRASRIAGQHQEPNGRWFIRRLQDRAPVVIKPPTSHAPPSATALESDADGLAEVCRYLTDPKSRVQAGDWPGRLSQDSLRQPGLYTWWADAVGAADLAAGLAMPVSEGLIYAGQTGAGTSSATLAGRIGRNHLRGNIRGPRSGGPSLRS